jgi:hypothetical protein
MNKAPSPISHTHSLSTLNTGSFRIACSRPIPLPTLQSHCKSHYIFHPRAPTPSCLPQSKPPPVSLNNAPHISLTYLANPTDKTSLPIHRCLPDGHRERHRLNPDGHRQRHRQRLQHHHLLPDMRQGRQAEHEDETSCRAEWGLMSSEKGRERNETAKRSEGPH